jgi:hypothetical protein
MAGMVLDDTNFGRGAGNYENSYDGTAPRKNVEERLWTAWVWRQIRKSRCIEAVKGPVKHGRMDSTKMQACHHYELCPVAALAI